MDPTTDVDQLLAQLAEAGERRANADRHEVDGFQELLKAYEDIREASAHARRVGITRKAMADAVGVSQETLWEITTGRRRT